MHAHKNIATHKRDIFYRHYPSLSSIPLFSSPSAAALQVSLAKAPAPKSTEALENAKARAHVIEPRTWDDSVYGGSHWIPLAGESHERAQSYASNEGETVRGVPQNC